MAIVIVDNFQINIENPIDNRFVVGSQSIPSGGLYPTPFYKYKDDILFKYPGLRIWDFNDNLPYVWSGVTWSNENITGASVIGAGAGFENYIPKFDGNNTVLNKSLLFDNSSNVGLGLFGTSILPNNVQQWSGTVLTNITTNTNNSLHVSGNIKTNQFFSGDGSYIINIHADNIRTGKLALDRITNPLITGNQILTSISGITQWSLPSSVITIVDDTLTSTEQFLTFVSGTTFNRLNITSNKLQFKPNTGQILLSNGSVTEPIYSFINSQNTGIYYSNNGISTSVEGIEITSVRTYGLVSNNRIYIPTTSNNTDVGYGIVWSTNGNSTNNTTINDGFVYNGQRLNFYGIGSHIPDNSNTLSTLAGRGTYIAGYFGVDLFSGGRLKIKVDEYNDVTVNSVLNIDNTYTLGGSTGNNLVLATMKNTGGSVANNVVIKDWSVREGNTGDWLTWKHHNGITIDGFYNTPNGPNAITGFNTTDGTLTFWERFPHIREQYFGSESRKTLTINSSTSPFVKVDGNLLVGTNTISSSAVAEFTSTNKGIIPPRLTTTQRGTIVSPVAGVTIYNTTTKHMEVYDGTNWVGLSTTKVDFGQVITTNRYSQSGWNGYPDSTRNFAFVLPPSGYTISNLIGFIPSIAFIDYSGNVNSDDFLYCNYSVDNANNRVRVWCQNSENDSVSVVNYMAIYQK